MMRVIHVITRLILGGAQENTVASVLGLAGKPGLTVRLYSGPTRGPEGSLEASFAGAPDTYRIIPHLVRSVHPWHDMLALRQLTRLFREEAPDVVHTHSSKAGILGRLAARRAGVPVVVHTLHGLPFGAFQAGWVNRIFIAAERYAARATTHFISVADAMTRQALAAGIGRPERFTRIFSGFSLEPFLNAQNSVTERARLGLKADDFVVGKIARLFKLKGHEDLFRAAPALIARRPQIRFLIVGGGPWRERLEAGVRRLGLQKHVVFTGLVVPAEMPRLLGIMDTVVHLSRREGLARALPQALAAARPIVACDCDGAAEVCLNDETGFLIRPGDEEELVRRVVQLADDPGLRERLGRRGREFVRDRFPVERMVEDLHALYLRLRRA